MDRTQVTTTTSMFEADLFTHSGTFHADEVMATAIIAEMTGKEELRVYRTNRMDDVYPSPDSIVYDIGHGQYDHHQKGGNGCRENGVPYSSCGLIWRDFGMRICCAMANPELVWKLSAMNTRFLMAKTDTIIWIRNFMRDQIVSNCTKCNKKKRTSQVIA